MSDALFVGCFIRLRTYYCMVLLLLVYKMIITSHNSDLKSEFVPNVEINFQPFRDMIEKVVFGNKAHAGKLKTITKSSTTRDCAMPLSSIMFTYTTYYTMDLVVLQHEAMNVHGMRSCLEPRFVVACLDKECMSVCDAKSILNCVLLDMPKLPGSDFMQGAYNYLIYLKHDMMWEALQVVDEVFFFDADCLLFLNPWIDTRRGRDMKGQYIYQPYDLMFQRDRGRLRSCNGTVNTGQVYLRNTSKVANFHRNMDDFKQAIIRGPTLDQDFVGNASRTAGLRHCSLPPQTFTSACLRVMGNMKAVGAHNTPLGNMVSYHTSCVRGSKNKKALLASVLHAKRQSGGSTVGKVV